MDKSRQLQKGAVTCSKSHTRLLTDAKQNPGMDLHTHYRTAGADRGTTVFQGTGQERELCRSCNCSVVITKWGCSAENLRVIALAAT